MNSWQYTSSKYQLLLLVSSLTLTTLNTKLEQCLLKLSSSCDIVNSVPFYFRTYDMLDTRQPEALGS